MVMLPGACMVPRPPGHFTDFTHEEIETEQTSWGGQLFRPATSVLLP